MGEFTDEERAQIHAELDRVLASYARFEGRPSPAPIVIQARPGRRKRCWAIGCLHPAGHKGRHGPQRA